MFGSVKNMSQKNKSYQGPTEPLEMVWNGIFNELSLYQRQVVGKVLTIIDAVIVDPSQNKSVKDLIKDAVYQYPHRDNTEVNMARWLNWLAATNEIKPGDCDEDIPMRYQGPPVAELKHYKDKK
jgi:hypothetical protein